MAGSRLTEVVERLMTDSELQERLRQDQPAFAEEHGLTAEETNALLDGDELRLIALGVPASAFHVESSDRSWIARALLRTAVPALAVLATLGIAMGPVPTAAAARARYGIRVRRAGLSGRWAVHPRAVRAVRRSSIRQGRFLRTDIRMVRFAKAKAFGLYASEDAALSALRQVDPKIGDVKDGGGEVIGLD